MGLQANLKESYSISSSDFLSVVLESLCIRITFNTKLAKN